MCAAARKPCKTAGLKTGYLMSWKEAGGSESVPAAAHDLALLHFLNLILHPVTATFDHHRLGVVHQPIQYRGG
jgi:hypothetical protein